VTCQERAEGQASRNGLTFAFRMAMRIAVTSLNLTLDDQTRAYTEYKVFSALAHFARGIDHVEVILSEQPSRHNGFDTACDVHVILTAAARVRTRACAARAYSAIDRAARRIKEAMSRQIHARGPSGDFMSDVSS
jgi:ribosomal subunit interface protein